MRKSIDSNARDKFQVAVQSLKLYRRAELVKENNKKLIIKDLYVDPLPNDFILKKMKEPNTTFLIGRKGTGKSTIFQRVQYHILEEKNKTSSYIDMKTIYESSQIDGHLLNKINKTGHIFDENELKKILLYRAFIRDVISEIKIQLRRELDLGVIKKFFDSSIKKVFQEMDNLLNSATDDNFQSILGIQFQQVSNLSYKKKQRDIGGKISGKLEQESPRIELEASIGKNHNISNMEKINYTDVLIRHFNIKDYIISLKTILEKHEIRNLYIFVDDFSELPEDAMRIVVDTLLGPLNNWSDEFVKFKIAAYPNRIYFGDIDKTKIDEIYLDSYKLYANGNPEKEVDNGIGFTKRLLQKRIDYYCNIPINNFLNDSDSSDIWKTIYQATMGNPRVIGYLLSFAHETNLNNDKKIDSKSIRLASERYFEEKIEPYFLMNKFLHESFQERSSVHSLKELLESLISKSKDVAHKLGIDTIDQNTSDRKIPSSHFHINQEFDSILSTLEINFFLSKRLECLDKDRKKVSVYCFNYGLCQKFDIIFGSPPEQQSYFIERHFDYSPIIQKYIQQNQELNCTSCGTTHDYSLLQSIKTYNWLCPSCRKGKCKLVSLSRKYEKEIKKIKGELLLPAIEFEILSILYNKNHPLFPKDIAGELDCSYQLVGKRASKLAQKELIIKEKNQNNRIVYKISNLGKSSYFSSELQEHLSL